jgi:hypothetical protein
MSDRYTKPEAGTQNWHEPLNDNFDAIGTDVDALESRAPLWGGYELVFDDETPESEQYVRIETK